ncbi:hypothetical protein SDC9_124442 [bioreactor metagenome]|uniref:NADPH-dependent FMN reductase-like domain-containing protein n=1 Tax=bioreactor metagenome TaxID=1076179 RepID=A0A645CKH7_9ZZZZ
MFCKKAAVISTTAGAGASQAIKGVAKTLFYWGVPFIRSYGIGVQAMNWESVKDKKKAKIDRDITKLAKKLSDAGAPRVNIKTKILFNMMRNMQKAGWGSSPVEKHYWSACGWLDKKRPWKD